LAVQLERVVSFLRATPGLAGTADFYDPNAISSLMQKCISDPGATLLKSLLFVEAQIIREATEAGVSLAGFLRKPEATPDQLLELLTRFGSRATEAFHAQLASVYGGDAIRPLGTMLFVEAAAALKPEAQTSDASATLELIVVRKDSVFPLASYLGGEIPPPTDIVLQQRLLSLV
jgi:hypothetical protein